MVARGGMGPPNVRTDASRKASILKESQPRLTLCLPSHSHLTSGLPTPPALLENARNPLRIRKSRGGSVHVQETRGTEEQAAGHKEVNRQTQNVVRVHGRQAGAFSKSVT